MSNRWCLAGALRFAAGLLAAWCVLFIAAPASAMPIFAQRYHLRCSACHTALPELNEMGNYFRDHGYRLPPGAEKHGTTVVALRYNNEWENDPASGSRRFTGSSSLLAQEDIGAVSAYVHYGLGSGGAPSSFYLGFLSTYNAHTKELWRLGLFELPLTQSPGQRLDTIQEYGYFGTSVGQNDLDLNAPRLGLETERQVGAVKLSGTLAFGEFKGAAYGGAPVFTGATTTAARPELGLYARLPINSFINVNAQILDGERKIALPGRAPFDDDYDRLGYGADFFFFQKRLDLTAQQWLGRDNDPDGADDALDSSGGYLRLKYFLTPHLFVSSRYDTAANPFPNRSFINDIGALVFNHARIVLERRVDLIRGTPTYGGYLTVAGPWAIGY